MDVAPWCYKWDGMGLDGYPVGVRYGAPYNVNNNQY